MKEKAMIKKSNKIVTTLVIINIVVIAIIILIAMYYSKYSSDEIRHLVRKNTYVSNFKVVEKNTYIYGNDETYTSTTITIAKDSVQKVINDDTKISWNLMDKIINENSKVIVLLNKENIEERKETENKLYIPALTDIFYISKEPTYDFKFIKEEKVNDKECIVVEYIASKDELKLFSDDSEVRIRYWIEKETGFPLIERKYTKSGKMVYEKVCDICFNCVTDEDLILPDTNGYREIKQGEDGSIDYY